MEKSEQCSTKHPAGDGSALTNSRQPGEHQEKSRKQQKRATRRASVSARPVLMADGGLFCACVLLCLWLPRCLACLWSQKALCFLDKTSYKLISNKQLSNYSLYSSACARIRARGACMRIGWRWEDAWERGERPVPTVVPSQCVSSIILKDTGCCAAVQISKKSTTFTAPV